MTEETFRTEYPHITRMPVRWGDMDSLVHVNNVLYFRYMESARLEYFQALGFGMPLSPNSTGPILVQIECQFRRAVVYPDTLLIGTSIHHIGQSSLKMRHDLYSLDQQQIVASGDSVIVHIDYATMEKVLISDELRIRISDFENA